MDRLLALPLIQRIYEAALDVSRWQEFVQELSDAFRGAPAGIALQPPGSPLAGVIFRSRGFRDEFHPRFDVYAQKGLPWEEGRRRNFVGRFGLTTEVIADERLHASDFYREWMAPQGLGPHAPVAHTIALDAGNPAAALAIFPTAATGPFGVPDLEFGNLLVPHLALGYRLLAENR